MTDPVPLTASETIPPSHSGIRTLWLGLATVALLLVVIGTVWVIGQDGAANSQSAAAIQPVDDHASAATHSDGESYSAETNAVNAHEGDNHTSTDTHSGGESHQASIGDTHAVPTEHGAVEEHGHADTESPAHAAEEVTHSEAGGHGTQAAPVSPQTKQVVLGGFLGINGLVILGAAVLRRRNPPRLPKYLQPLTQGSKP